MGLCENCKITMCREEMDDGIGCAEFVAKDTNVLTNADRIRAMDDDELANFLSNWGGCNKCKFRDTCTSSIGSVSKICKEIHLEWLKQPEQEEL